MPWSSSPTGPWGGAAGQEAGHGLGLTNDKSPYLSGLGMMVNLFDHRRLAIIGQSIHDEPPAEQKDDAVSAT